MNQNGSSDLAWRYPLARLRWLLLGSVCAAAPSCGGRASLGDDDSGSGGVAGASVNAGAVGGSAGTYGGASGGTYGGASGGTYGGASGGVSGSSGAGGATVTLPAAPLTLQCESSLVGGWESCNGSAKHRVEFEQCESQVPRPFQIAIPRPYSGYSVECQYDGDCDDAAYGQCNSPDMLNSFCTYGCTRDDECESGFACVCGDVVGQCQRAHCRSDADCAPGLACLGSTSDVTGGDSILLCQAIGDECIGSADCAGRPCRVGDSTDLRRRCEPWADPSTGRPYLIEGEARRACAVQRSDWLCATSEPRVLERELRDALAAHWLEQGLMEHASVAAFARFTLQLLAVGAPAELVTGSARAMQDEIAHAEGCFGLARRYSGKDLGPGPLPLEGALERGDLWSIVHDTVLEGCIGETVAAVEAGEASARCEDDAVRPLLERIAREEYQHATLAWRFLRWALERDAELVPRVQALFARVLSEREAGAARVLEANAAELGRHGVLSPALRQGLAQRVLRDVVAPCANALCGARGVAAREDAASGVAAPLA